MCVCVKLPDCNKIIKYLNRQASTFYTNIINVPSYGFNFLTIKFVLACNFPN